jgi:hypothetical protein
MKKPLSEHSDYSEVRDYLNKLSQAAKSHNWVEFDRIEKEERPC